MSSRNWLENQILGVGIPSSIVAFTRPHNPCVRSIRGRGPAISIVEIRMGLPPVLRRWTPTPRPTRAAPVLMIPL